MSTNACGPRHATHLATSLFAFLWLIVMGVSGFAADETSEPRLRLDFLGDNGHHEPARRAAELLPVLAERGIDVRYSDNLDDVLSPENLKQLDGLIVYANIDEISDSQAQALLNFVQSGGGFIPLHCASYCFRNNADVVALIGAQFQRHGTGVFTVMPTEAAASHPLMQGYQSFESWDETYVHTLHNERDRTVLEYRQEGNQREPWTWIRRQGRWASVLHRLGPRLTNVREPRISEFGGTGNSLGMWPGPFRGPRVRRRSTRTAHRDEDDRAAQRCSTD